MAHNCLSPPAPPPSQLSAKPLIETNFQYNRTTNSMTDATKSDVVSIFLFLTFPTISLLLLCTLWLPLLDAPKSVTFYERSFVLPHRTYTILLHPLYQLYLLLSCCRFFTSLHFLCCFCNFMFLTNLSLSGLLFTLGSFLSPSSFSPFSKTIAFNVLVADD